MPTIFQIAKEKLHDNKQATAEATTGIFDNIKTRTKIKSLEKQKEKFYIEIGKKFYKMNAGEYDIAFEEQMKSIHKLQDTIEQLSETLPENKVTVESEPTCQNCGATLSDDTPYCPHCGNRVKEVEPAPVEEEIIEDDGKKKISFETVQPQDGDEFFDPGDEEDDDDGADETVKTKKEYEDEDLENFFHDMEE